jgi:hypothetical protein
MGGTVVGPTYYYPAYTRTVLNYAATRGGMLVQVTGNPFDQVTGEQLAREIARTMERSHFGPEVPFITEAPDNFTSPYRVAVVIDPVQTVQAYKVCGNEHEITGGDADGVVRVHAVLCGNEKPLSAVSGQAASVAGPDDPQFRQLIGQISLLLFPLRKGTGGRRGRGFFGN